MFFYKTQMMLFLFIICILFVNTACTKKELSLPSIQKSSVNDEPNIYLNTPELAQSINIELVAGSCSGVSKIYVTEYVTEIPNGTEVSWQDCSAVRGQPMNYTLSSSTVGLKNVYVWTKNDLGKISTSSKNIKIRYAPKIVIGKSTFSDNNQFKVGYSNPIQVQQINGKYYFLSMGGSTGFSKISVFNSEPSSNFAMPDLILGHPNNFLFQGVRIGPNRFYNATSFDSDGTKFAVVDNANNRVLLWNQIPTSPNTNADVVLGQANFWTNNTNNGKGASSPLMDCTDLSSPRVVKFYGGKLYVSDYGNNRILVWNTWPTTNNQAADFVIGQSSCSGYSASTSTLSGPLGMEFSGTKMFVADYVNNRVLIWNTIPTTFNTTADLVLGQSTMSQNTLNNGGVNSSGLYRPSSVYTDGTKLIVSDGSNNRTLIWNSLPTVNKQAADVVVGQSNFTANNNNQTAEASATSLNVLIGFSQIVGGNLWIADYGNQRFLKYTGVPTSNGASATFVLGQENFRNNSSLSEGTNDKTINKPIFVEIINNKVYISTYYHHRITGYNSVPTSSNPSADFLWGQNDFNSDNLNKATLATPTSLSLYGPMGMASAGGKYFIADNGNNRVLGFNSPPTSNATAADFVLGQSTLTTGTINAGGISAATLSAPRQVSTDGTKLVVADYGNHRVLIWNSIPSSSMTPADVVIGQPDAVSNTANKNGMSAATLYNPQGVLLYNNKLVVADTANRRILIWDPIPSVTGTPANYVIGQSSFTSSLAVNTSLPSTLNIVPVFLSSYNGNLIVSSASSILTWDQIPTSNNQPPDRIFGNTMKVNLNGNSEPNLSEHLLFEPYSAISDGVRLWIADNNNNRVVVTPVIDFSVTSGMQTNNTSIQLTVHNCDNHESVLFSETTVEPDSGDSSWRVCSTNRNAYGYTLSSGEGLKTIYAWFKDKHGNVIPNAQSTVVWYILTNNFIPKGTLSVTTYTNNPTVSFFNSYNSIYANKYYISESSATPLITDSGWLVNDNSGSYSFTLTNTTEGVKTIYVWSTDLAGNISNTPIQFKFTYDTTPPAAPSISLAGFYAASAATVVRLTVNSCSDINKIYVSESSATPSASASSWLTCVTTAAGTSYSLPSLTEGNHTLYVWSQDIAGNVSTSPTSVSVNFNSVLALGQANTNSISNASQGLFSITDVQSDGSKFIVSDYANGRVLIFNSDPTVQSTPDVILGQNSATEVGAATASLSSTSADANSLLDPYGAIIVGTKVVVAEQSRNRVLIWNSIPTSNNQPADIVLGQTSLTGLTANSGGISCATLSAPKFPFSDGTRLIVTDTNNNRVLIWNTFPTVSGQPADVVVGQSSCTANSSGTTQSKLKTPMSASYFSSRLYVADYANHRVLIWNSLPSTNGLNADVVMGQTDFVSSSFSTRSASSLNGPAKIVEFGNKLYVADRLNNRLLVYNNIPTANAAAADVVVGQANFTGSSSGAGAAALNTPISLWLDTNYMWVADNGNNQIRRYSLPLTTGMSATGLRNGDTYSSAYINARPVATAANNNLYRPYSAVFIGSKLAVADYLNNRVLIWNTIPTSGTQAADVVLGHNDFSSVSNNDAAVVQGARLYSPVSLATDGTNLMVADYNNNRVLVWNTVPTVSGTAASFVLGQSSFAGSSSNRGGSVAANTLAGPIALLYSGSKLYVADYNNHRVLVWNSLPSSDGVAADFAIGQANLTSNTANAGSGTSSATAAGLYLPRGIAIVGTKLFISEYGNNRVSVRNSLPTASGSSADFAIGQSSLTAQTAAATSSGLSRPHHIKYLNNKLFICDYSNTRVVGFSTLPTASGASYDFIIGQYSTTSTYYNSKGLTAWSFANPIDISFDGNYYWVTDSVNNRIVKMTLPY